MSRWLLLLMLCLLGILAATGKKSDPHDQDRDDDDARFSLTLTPATVSLTPGAGTTVTIGIQRKHGYGKPVSLAVAGAPAGVTASLSPSSTTGNSATLSLASLATASAGTSTLLIGGAAGESTQTVQLALTLVAPPVVATNDFTLSVTPTTASLPAGTSTTVEVDIARSTSFTGPVTLNVAGLPAGVTAAFDAMPVTGNKAMLTLTAAAGATIGTGTLTINGAGGNAPASTQLSLTVVADDYALSATPAAVSLPVGTSTTVEVDVARSATFTGPVTLSVSGVPSGVTLAFDAMPVTGSKAMLTLTAAAGATLNASTLTISGTGGNVPASTQVSLIVVPDDFSLSAAPATVSLLVGASATVEVDIARSATFTGPVTLNVAGLPSGVTSAFDAMPVTGNKAMLTLTAASASPGLSTLTISGTGGNAPASTQAQLTVLAPLSVSVQPTSATVAVKTTQQFTATVVNASNSAVAWSVNDVVGGNVTVGTISSSGLYTAPAARPHPITVTVKATSQQDSITAAAAQVTVTAPGTLYVPDSAGGMYVFANASSVNGNVAPTGALPNDGTTHLIWSSGALVDGSHDEIFVPVYSTGQLLTFTGLATLNGDVAPAHILGGSNTKLSFIEDVAVDWQRSRLYVAGQSTALVVFDPSTQLDGNATPLHVIQGASTTLGASDKRLFLDTAADRLYVADAGTGAVLVFDQVSTLDGNVAPTRSLTGSSTGLLAPWGVTVDVGRDLLYVSDYVMGKVSTFANASTLNGDVAPLHTFTIDNPALSFPEDLQLDPETDRLAVSCEPDGTAVAGIFFFEGASTLDGTNLMPARRVQGNQTQLIDPQGMAVDWDR